MKTKYKLQVSIYFPQSERKDSFLTKKTLVRSGEKEEGDRTMRELEGSLRGLHAIKLDHGFRFANYSINIGLPLFSFKLLCTIIQIYIIAVKYKTKNCIECYK